MPRVSGPSVKAGAASSGDRGPGMGAGRGAKGVRLIGTRRADRGKGRTGRQGVRLIGSPERFGAGFGPDSTKSRQRSARQLAPNAPGCRQGRCRGVCRQSYRPELSGRPGASWGVVLRRAQRPSRARKGVPSRESRSRQPDRDSCSTFSSSSPRRSISQEVARSDGGASAGRGMSRGGGEGGGRAVDRSGAGGSSGAGSSRSRSSARSSATSC